MRLRTLSFAGAAVAVVAGSTAARAGNTLTVGPNGTYKAPCAAFAAAADGDTIAIDPAGSYAGDICVISKNGLTIRSTTPALVKLDATGQTISNGKAIWVIAGDDTTVQDIEFFGASVPDANGAGIRQEGKNLTVQNCWFHDNQDGILAGDNMGSTILIEHSQFNHNGAGDGYSHNLYINHVSKLTFQYNYSHHANVGHLLKSRALENHILYNRLTDETTGQASYELDLPNGGLSYVIGNLIEQGPNTMNGSIVDFALEGAQPMSDLFFVNNTVVNDRMNGGTFLNIDASVTTPAVVRNNIFFGPGTVASQASAVLDHNLVMTDPMFAGGPQYDYHLKAGSPAVDMGVDPGMGDGQSLSPTHQYVHPHSEEGRTTVGVIDIGAYELGGGSTTGAGGSPTSGPGGTGGDVTAGPMSSSASSGATGGAGGSGSGAQPGDTGGCGCRTASGASSRAAVGLLLLGLLAFAKRRR